MRERSRRYMGENRVFKKIVAIQTWFTRKESGCDERTGCIAELRQRRRLPSDKPGKNALYVWDWVVHAPMGAAPRFRGQGTLLASGTAQNQKGARSAAREVVRKQPELEHVKNVAQ